MFDMIDVIQMTKISKHYLLEYQTLLESYEMQSPNVTSGFRVIDFSEDISDVDYTSDDWSMNESFSETSGDLSNSVQANLLANPPEYSVCAGSKPLSIIIRRCNTPTAVCPSPVQGIDKENSFANSNSSVPAQCGVTDLFVCQELDVHANSESDKDIKVNNIESTDAVEECKEYELFEIKKENHYLKNVTLSESVNKDTAINISDEEHIAVEKVSNHLGSDNVTVCEQKEQVFSPVHCELQCVEENSKNASVSYPCSEEPNENNVGRKEIDLVIPKALDDNPTALGNIDFSHSDQMSSSITINGSSSIKCCSVNVAKHRSCLNDQFNLSMQSSSSNIANITFNYSHLNEEHLLSEDAVADYEVNSITTSFCHENVAVFDRNSSDSNMKEQSSLGFEENSDAHTSEVLGRWQQLSCSPLLFSSDDESSSITEEVNRGIEAALAPSPQYSVILSSEKRKVGKLQEMLMGAPPPPVVTMPLHSASEMLNALRDSMVMTATEKMGNSRSSVMHWCQEAVCTSWPQVKCLQYHGIHYNHGAVSEQFESLCQKLLTRCVGGETASSVTIWSSFTLPAPRRERKVLSSRRSGTQPPSGLSPGRRLSHLARRHRTFSSAMLLNDSARLHNVLPHAAPERRTILVEGRKKEIRKLRSSQKKKKGDNCDKSRDIHTVKLNSSKRALFQSPTEEEKKSVASSKFRPSSESAVRSRRALFVGDMTNSQGRCSSTSVGDNTSASTSRKRVREDSEDEFCERLPRRRLFSDAETNPSSASNEGNARRGELSSTHKKKLLWAVAEALKKCGIGLTHPQFRACAAALASICRGHVQQVLALRQGSTSDRLLQLALRFVNNVVAQHFKEPSDPS